MTLLSAVSDANPLIAREQIGLLERFAPLFASCIVPPVVAREIAPTVYLPPWIVVHPPAAPIDPQILFASLDPGETEALGLAHQLGGHHVLVDDLPARRVAAALGLPVIGTVGLLAVAKQQGILAAVRPSLEALRATGFFLSRAVIDEVLSNAGERGA